MGALVSLLVVLGISLLITRVASVALQQTGLSQEAAKFQARSAFTGVGFTTSESESIARHPVRRRIAATLMLLGNVGVVTSISSLILTFVDTKEGAAGWALRVGLLAGGIAVLWLFASSQWVEVRLSRLIERALQRWTRLDVRDYGRLLRLSNDYELVELEISEGDWLCGRTLSEAKLREEGVEVLGISRRDGRYLGVPWKTVRIHEGDTLILYGRRDSLENLDVREEGHQGERAHDEAVAKQQQVQTSERTQDESAQQGKS